MNGLTLSLLRLGQATRAIGLDQAHAAGLTPVQAETLRFVQHTKSFATSIGNLAAHLGATHASTVEVVNGLVRRRLLVREPSDTDRRVKLLRLTPQGEEACRGLENWGRQLEEAMAGLTPREQAAVERGLGAIIWSLRAAGHLTVAEPCRGCVYFRENAAPGTFDPHHCDLIQRFLSDEEAAKYCPDHTPAVPADAKTGG